MSAKKTAPSSIQLPHDAAVARILALIKQENAALPTDVDQLNLVTDLIGELQTLLEDQL